MRVEKERGFRFNGFFEAALSMRHRQTALGAYYRHIGRRKDGDVAVFARARKLATLIYRLLRWGQPYVDEGAEAYEKRQKPDCRGQRRRLLAYARCYPAVRVRPVGNGKSQTSRSGSSLAVRPAVV